MIASCIAIYPAAQLSGIHANGVESMRPPQFKIAEHSHVRYAVRVKIGQSSKRGQGSKESLVQPVPLPSAPQLWHTLSPLKCWPWKTNDTTSRWAWVKTASHSFRQEQPRVGILARFSWWGAYRTWKVSIGCCTHSACLYGASRCSFSKNTGYVRMINLEFPSSWGNQDPQQLLQLVAIQRLGWNGWKTSCRQ